MRLLVLDRYIARELLSPFAFGCMLFTFFLVIDRIYNLTDLTAGLTLVLNPAANGELQRQAP